MKFIETKLKGVFIIEPEQLEDERGFFARTFCRNEFEDHGLNPNFVQCSISFNKKKGTLRGIHYQVKPYEEAKLVRCLSGAAYDVVVDMRVGSESYREWMALEISGDNRRQLYIPEGCAHGFQTLVDHTEIIYQMSEYYHHEYAYGLRWDDDLLQIKWPLSNPILSKKDKTYPYLIKGAR